MKLLGTILGFLLVCAIILLAVLHATGLPPKDRRPGLWLKGDLVTAPVTDWSFAKQFQLDQVQVRTWYGVPHSVNTGFIVADDQLYLTSGFPPGMPYPRGKAWTSAIYRDPHVRIKFGDKLYDRVAVPVSDPAEQARVMAAVTAPPVTSANPPPNMTMHLFHVVPE